MVRKNIHLDDLVARGVQAVRHAARYQSETLAVNRLLEGAVEEVENRAGYVYLARSEKTGLLKVGYSANPARRSKDLAREDGGPVDIIAVLSGSRLLETAAHIRWSRLWVRGEWFQDAPEIVRWFEEHPQRDGDIQSKGRDVRVPVQMTAEEHRVVKEAADRAGVGVSTYLRQKALEAARRDG